MRRLILAAPAALALALSACATAESGPNAYQAEVDRLTATCTDRGGIIAPTGANTGRAPQDYVCQIRGQPARGG
ncbi:hypothetical protein GCM10009422_04290 [Brevundimonas kwangchunensis]|uniref:Hemolysin n=1 Tax=Brevundimonas kwangchunensis TaxID=322163 RepID=A0ABN1GJ21_9CAUL